MLLEGGPRLAGSFLDAGEVDEMRIFIAPIALGGRGARMPLEGEGSDSIADAQRALSTSVEDDRRGRADHGAVQGVVGRSHGFARIGRRGLFTGLVQELGSVVARRRRRRRHALTVEAALRDELAAGDSVLVNGVCLTAVDPTAGASRPTSRSETLERSALGDLAPGEPVNLELALRPSDRLGGHIVQGHVDGVATVESVAADGAGSTVAFRAPPALLRYIVEKGSVAVDGVSLTVSAAGRRRLLGLADPRDPRADQPHTGRAGPPG